MYRESHERKCPTCGEWMSATAPKCLNCGEYVSDGEEEEDDEEPARWAARMPWIVGGAAFLGGVGLLIYYFTK